MEHVWGDKRIPSGFFYLPNAAHITAVISNRQGTISKFNRMGLTTSETFARFLDEFPPSLKGVVRLYRLMDWEKESKRAFAWVSFEGRSPSDGEPDPPQVAKFLGAIARSDSLKSLSGVPYYCTLLIRLEK